ncbi:hypothetical protein [Sphingomonas oligophenolica]|uniref:TonB-dependent receptor n=1 Tax=Sphingomonas oligophenolica TaxID=301154 RepID=A0A502C371_9SPHN|nr:hypothetical protein [Sphingomonas oligophenolica]TPG06361.1 hypothetical protein EAH84_14895 [Sphingomonas oligophenolica]
MLKNLSLAWALAAAIAAPESAAVGQLNDPAAAERIAPSAGKGLRAGNDDILVIGIRLRGEAIGGVAPVRRIDAGEIASYGAGTVSDLVEALEPETRGNSGAASPPQIVLLNGSRIANFSDIGGLPAEAIQRIDILPEEVALAYGYPAGARVLNLVTRERFRALTLDSSAGAATRGGRYSLSTDWNLARIRGESRIIVDLSLARDGALDESERDIPLAPAGPLFAAGGNAAAPVFGAEIDPALSALAGTIVTVAPVPGTTQTLAQFAVGAQSPAQTDLRPFRTLLPETTRFVLGASISRPLFSRIAATISGRVTSTRSESGFGRAPVELFVPDANPFSPFASDVLLLGLAPAPLRRDSRTDTARLSALFSGDFGLWRWTATATGEHAYATTRDSGRVDTAALQARVLAADPAANPFAAIAGPFDPAARLSSSRSRRGAIDLSAAGPLARLPAGDLFLSLSASAEHLGLVSRGFEAPGPARLARTQTWAAASLDAPLSRGNASLGGLAANFNVTVRNIPRFGWLRTWGAGLRWAPDPIVSFNLSYIDDDGFPTLQEIGEPVVPIPSFLIFDPIRGETVSVTRLEGGNPLLHPNNRRERKIEAILRPPGAAGITLSVNYSEVDLDNPIATFPIVSPDLEAAFPGRFQRDGSGRLILVDARAISVASSHFRGLRSGLQYVTQPAPGDRNPTRFAASLFHTWRFRNDIRTVAGGPVLDLLDGAAVGPRGGVPRHLIEGNARLTRGALGAFVSGSWQADSLVRGGSGDLIYADRPRLNAWLFLNLGQLGSASSLPAWLRAGRLTLSVENALDARLQVRDAAGQTPFAFHPAYLDPQGRTLRIGFRTFIK